MYSLVLVLIISSIISIKNWENSVLQNHFSKGGCELITSLFIKKGEISSCINFPQSFTTLIVFNSNWKLRKYSSPKPFLIKIEKFVDFDYLPFFGKKGGNFWN